MIVDGKIYDQLEELIDQHGLSTISGVMADVCYDKSKQHAAEFFDMKVSKSWLKFGTLFESIKETSEKEIP
jgi:hypothetical protein